MAAIDNNVYANVLRVAAGNLRNGDPAQIARTARESAIPAKYFWTAPTWAAAFAGDANAFSPALPAGVLIDTCIRAAFAQHVEATVAEQAAAHAAAAAPGAAAFNEAQARTDATAVRATRIEAIGIGAARAAAVVSYRVTAGELTRTEAAPELFRLVAPAGAGNAAAFADLERTNSAGWTVELASGNALAAATPAERVALEFAPLTTEEYSLAFAMFSLGQASPVRAGAQLFLDGHHYHSDEASTARHRAIEREVLGKTDAAARDLWNGNRDALRNAVWHAAIHPISAGVLQSFAEDNTIADRLNATGYGSMSVGLPAQEDAFKRAGSYRAVLNAVGPVIARHGHRVTMAKLEAAVIALAALPRTGALPGVRPALPDNPSAPWPASCTTRAQAVKLFLVPFLDASEPVAAWLFGYYSEIAAAANVRRATQEGSLLRSYSLRRAMANHIASFNEGQSMYRAYTRFARTQAEDGILDTYAADV